MSGRAALCSQPITPAAPWPGQKALLLHHAQALFHKHHHRWSLLQPVPRPQGPEEGSWQWTAQGSSSSCKLTTHIWNSGQMPGPLDGEAGILTFRTKCEELHSQEHFWAVRALQHTQLSGVLQALPRGLPQCAGICMAHSQSLTLLLAWLVMMCPFLIVRGAFPLPTGA